MLKHDMRPMTEADLMKKYAHFEDCASYVQDIMTDCIRRQRCTVDRLRPNDKTKVRYWHIDDEVITLEEKEELEMALQGYSEVSGEACDKMMHGGVFDIEASSMGPLRNDTLNQAFENMHEPQPAPLPITDEPTTEPLQKSEKNKNKGKGKGKGKNKGKGKSAKDADQQPEGAEGTEGEPAGDPQTARAESPLAKLRALHNKLARLTGDCYRLITTVRPLPASGEISTMLEGANATMTEQAEAIHSLIEMKCNDAETIKPYQKTGQQIIDYFNQTKAYAQAYISVNRRLARSNTLFLNLLQILFFVLDYTSYMYMNI